MSQWIEVCATDDIDQEDVMRFDHQGQTFAIYHSPDNKFYATDGLCTHERVHLADGLVMDNKGGAGLRQSQNLSGQG
jgi:3-phenylpropionate/trans-cinnamate dioxygenase ferredoxin component